MRPEDRERIQVEVVSRVVERCMERRRMSSEGYLETLVNDTLYHERQRLKTEPPGEKRTKDDGAFYARIHRRMQHASAGDLRALLEMIARRFVGEVVGNFDDRVYQASTRIIPTGLNLLLNALSPGRVLRGDVGGMAESIVLEGELEQVRRLVDHGTLVVVPTHSSNLDSIVLGFAVYLLGLPPLLYGAGLNLFTNPMISFFMRNLGAYRVDRRKKAQVYKDVLKEYATCAMEMGYHNLFFPGGTRSRSGAVEQKLKKGLLGTAVRAYVGNLQSGKKRPNIYVVPVALSYKLVLEAETLVEDHLKEVGKSRYIIIDDEFSKPRRILTFFSHLMSLDAKIVFHFGQPLDLFGNKVDEKGISRDPHNRPVDTSRYVAGRDGAPVYDDQRDREYTNEVAQQIVAAFLSSNTLMSTHVVAFALFELLKRNNPDLDLYRLLRTGGDAPSFTMTDVHLETERVLSTLRELDNGPRFGSELVSGDVQEIVADALKHFSIFHAHPAAVRRGDRVFHEDRNLLLYYGNQLRGYDLGRKLGAAAA